MGAIALSGHQLALSKPSKRTALPFKKDGHRSELSVRWRDVDVAAWLRHAQPLLPKPWAITPRAGGLSTDLRVVFEQPPGDEAPRLMVQGDMTVDKLDLGLPTVPGVVVAGQALGPVDLGWGAVRLQGLNLQPLVGYFSVAQVVLDNGHLAVQGRVGTKAKATSAAEGATVLWPRLQALSATVRGLDNQPQAKPAAWQVSLDDASGSRLQAQGAWHVAQAQGDARLQLSNGAVPAWWAALASRLGVPVAPRAGRLGVQALVAVQTKPVLAVRLSEGQASLDDVDATLLPSLPASHGDAVGWKSLALDGVQAAWSANDGAPRWAVAQVALRDAHGRWHDTTPSTPAAWQWAQTTATVGGLSHDLSQPLQVQLQTRAQGAGQIRFKGEVRPQPLRVQGQLALQSLDLRARLLRGLCARGQVVFHRIVAHGRQHPPGGQCTRRPVVRRRGFVPGCDVDRHRFFPARRGCSRIAARRHPQGDSHAHPHPHRFHGHPCPAVGKSRRRR